MSKLLVAGTAWLSAGGYDLLEEIREEVDSFPIISSFPEQSYPTYSIK